MHNIAGNDIAVNDIAVNHIAVNHIAVDLSATPGAPASAICQAGPMAAEIQDHTLQSWFESYLRVCNQHVFDRLGHFVATDVMVNGRPAGLETYVTGLRKVARGFPDYRWTLQHLVMNDGWLAAHYLDTGTHLGTFMGIGATGVRVRTDEFAFYRITDFMITEVWVTADNVGLLEQIRRR